MTWEDRYPADRLLPYDHGWAEIYMVIAAGLRDALGPCWRIEHVGSTSVVGLIAKPVIDIAIRIPLGESTTGAHLALARSGWTATVPIGDHEAMFLLDGTVRRVIGRLFTAEQWPLAHVRLFARWLREHDRDREHYADLKTTLVARGTWGSDYTTAKGGYVLEIVNRARVERGLCPLASL